MAKHDNSLKNFFEGVAYAAIATLFDSAPSNNSVINPTPSQYILARMLGVEPSFILFLDSVYDGSLDGYALVGIEDHPAVLLARHLMIKRYGFIQHPLHSAGTPIHPLTKMKFDKFISSK